MALKLASSSPPHVPKTSTVPSGWVAVAVAVVVVVVVVVDVVPVAVTVVVTVDVAVVLGEAVHAKSESNVITSIPMNNFLKCDFLIFLLR